MTVAPSRFAAHLRWLRRLGFRALSIGDVVRWASGEPLPDRGVLITFDDGYADLAEHAFPALAAAGFSAIVFPVTGYLGRTNRWEEPVGCAGHRILNAEAVKAWSRRGIEFGAHTRTHPDLSQLSPDEIEREMADSREDLESLLDRPIDSFAYPYAVVSPPVHALATRLFRIAFGADDGVNADGTDPYQIRRTMVLPLSRGVDVLLRARFGFSAKERARHRLAVARTRLTKRSA